MPENEKKRTDARRSAIVPIMKRNDAASVDVERDELSQYGDEGDAIQARIGKKKKKKKPASQKRKPGTRGASRSEAFPEVVPRKKKKKKKWKGLSYKRLLEYINNTDLIKPIRIAGHDIRFWPLIVAAALGILGMGVWMNNSQLDVVEQTVTVVGLPEDMEGYRIIVLSDLNGRRFGDAQSLLLRTINSLKYDLILCTGDMVGKGGNAQPFWEILEGLRYPERVYFICGDSDPGPYVSQARGTEGILSQLILEDWILGAIERGANYVDAPVCVSTKKSNLWLSPSTLLNLECTSTLESFQDQTEQEVDGVKQGISEDYSSLPITSYRTKLAQRLYDAQRTMTAADLHIAIAHEPPEETFIYTSEEHKATDGRFLTSPELIVAGHFCGGVWRLPLIGAFYIPDQTMPRGGWFPDQSRVSGLTTIGETQIYTAKGMSNNGAVALMPFRLFNAPEIDVLTLTSTLPENILEAG